LNLPLPPLFQAAPLFSGYPYDTGWLNRPPYRTGTYYRRRAQLSPLAYVRLSRSVSLMQVIRLSLRQNESPALCTPSQFECGGVDVSFLRRPLNLRSMCSLFRTSGNHRFVLRVSTVFRSFFIPNPSLPVHSYENPPSRRCLPS